MDCSTITRRRQQKPAASPESGHVRILPIDSILPSPENEQLYRRIDPSDPTIVALAASVREFGVCEPLVITLDGRILSGHRRHVAARLGGLTEVPCRVVAIRRHDPDYVRLLAEFNRQRTKSLDEQLREAVVAANPTEAYASLIEHREQKSFDALEGVDGGASSIFTCSSSKGPLIY
ncbi:MAG: ParB N-terminal domain-containing protein [Thermoguttaceae bacterium]